MAYEKIPIVETARRCGLVIDSRTLRRSEVEAACPFCGDHGAGKYHLSLNTDRNVYRCNLCGAHGNSVSLYARIKGVSNKRRSGNCRRKGKPIPFRSSRSHEKQNGSPYLLSRDTLPIRICWSI